MSEEYRKGMVAGIDLAITIIKLGLEDESK